MKKLKKFMFSPKGTLAAFAAAMVLLLLSTIGGARAALTQLSDIHNANIKTEHIGVTLREKVDDDTWNDIASVNSYERTGDDAKFDQVNETGSLLLPAIDADIKNPPEGVERGAKVGKIYPEELTVQNSGEIDQYVRVTIYKYWQDKDGKRRKDLEPKYIELGIADGWTEDTSARTKERTVLYYMGKPLKSKESVPVLNSITINSIVSGKDANGAYPYQGCSFGIEVQVDAVQTHNAEDAILSAWGKTVTVNDGSLSGIK